MMTHKKTDFQSVGRPQMPEGYGLKTGDATKLLPWQWLSERMAASRNYWIATTRPDGRPHVAPVWGVWFNDTLYFGTDPQSLKAKNMAANPAVSAHLESGDEVVIIEGTAWVLAVSDLPPQVDEAYQEKYAMTLTEAGAGATLIAVAPQTALAWLETDFPNTATRWRFSVAG